MCRQRTYKSDSTTEFMELVAPYYNAIETTEVTFENERIIVYADSMGQYIMYDILFNCNFDDKTIYDWEQVVKEVCPYLNERSNNNSLFASEYHYLLGRRKIRKR